jgi:hypothetical protein
MSPIRNVRAGGDGAARTAGTATPPTITPLSAISDHFDHSGTTGR